MASASDKVKKKPYVDHPNRRRIHNRGLALTLAKAGLHVFPSSGKVPLSIAWERADTAIGTDGAEAERVRVREEKQRNGKVHDERMHVGSTVDADVVKAMWRNFPDAVPSISLGPSKLFVLDADIDPERHGPTLLKQWLAEQGIDVSACPMVTTRSGAIHLYFKGDGVPSCIPPTLKRIYVQAKGVGGQTVAPGAWREDGKRYTPVEGTPGLALSFAMKTLPTPHRAILDLLNEKGLAATCGTKDEAAIITHLGAVPDENLPDHDADFINRFSATKLGADQSSVRWGLAKDVVATVADMSITPEKASEHVKSHLLGCDDELTGVYVGQAKPNEGEFGDREIARLTLKARAELEAHDKRLGAMFGTPDDPDVTDDVNTALAAIDAAIDAGDLPADDEKDRLLNCLPADRREAACLAFDDLNAATLLGRGEVEARAALDAVVKGVDASDVKPKNATKKASRHTPFQIESQHQAAERVAAMTVEPLIDGMLDQGALSVLYGPSNSGKSFVGAHVGYHIAAGLPWAGNATSKGAIIYFCLEGRTAFRRRVVALSRELDPHAPEKVSTFAVVETSALDLKSSAGDADRVIATVKSHEAATGEKVLLIVVDTMAAASPGLSENDGKDVTLLVEQLKRIRDACKTAHVMAIHHAGKDVARGARGHSSLRAAVDTEIEVADGKIAITKQRDHEFAPPIGFSLRPVNLGDDDNGRPMKTAIVELGGAVAADFGAAQDDEPTSEEKTLIEAVRIATTAKSGLAVAPGAVITEARRIDPHLRDVKDDTLGKKLRRFADEPYSPIERVGRHYRLREKPD